MKLFDSELKVMDLLWTQGELTAKDIAANLKAQVGWSKTTTYTVIKKCVEKGAVQRIDPGFQCRALVSRAETQEFETRELIDKLYGGAADQLVASLVSGKKLTAEEIHKLKKQIESWE